MILTKAAPQAYGLNILGGSDEDRGHQEIAQNALRKCSECAKKACQRNSGTHQTIVPQNAHQIWSKPTTKKNEAEEADGMEDREHQ